MSDPNEDIAVCGECKSINPDNYVGNSSFFKSGSLPPCKYCSGVLIVTLRKDIKAATDQVDRQRGLK